MKTPIYSDWYAFQPNDFKNLGYVLKLINHSVWFGYGLFHTNTIEGLWSKIKKYGAKIGVKPIYAALILFYALPKVSLADKAIIIGSLGYLISPLDLILDTIPIIGLADDAAALMFAYSRVKHNIDDEIRQKAKNKLSSLLGDYDESIISDL